jgi:hypothetical protein
MRNILPFTKDYSDEKLFGTLLSGDFPWVMDKLPQPVSRRNRKLRQGSYKWGREPEI